MWESVDLGEAAQRIRDHPEVEEMAAVRSPDRLYVLVEQQGLNYGPVLRDIVLDEIETEHPGVAVIVAREIPRTETGAVDPVASAGLGRQLAEHGRWVFGIDPPETEEEKIIASLLMEILGAERLSMTDSLPLLGADSLVLVELSGAVTERFGVTLDAMELFDVDDVRDLVRLVFGGDPSGQPA